MSRIAPADRRCLPVAQWPDLDRSLWRRAFDPGDILNGAGPAAGWSGKSIRTVEAAYGRWLSFLNETGPKTRVQSPADRLTKPNLRAYVAHLQKQVSSVTVRNRIRDVCEAVRVMEPNADLLVLRALMRRLWRQARPSRLKQARIVPAQHLYELGLELMDRAERQPVRNGPWRATRYRNGLMLALLSCRPLRRAELICLTIGQHVQIVHDTVTILLSEGDTKGRRPILYPWPDDLRAHLLHYMDHHRPALLGIRRTSRLWITHCGEPLTEDGFYHELRKTTRRELGFAVNPHLIRDAVVTSSVLQDPRLLPHASALLGHAGTTVTIASYNHAPAEDAYRRYQLILRNLRDRL